MEKAEKMSHVLYAALEIGAASGLRSVNISRVSKKSGVSRAWIYKYIGGTSKKLSEAASDEFGKALVALGSAEHADAQALQKHLAEMSWKMVEFFQKKPALLDLYFQHLGTKSQLGKIIEEFELQHENRLAPVIQKFFKIPRKEAAAIVDLLIALRFGVCHRAVKGGMGKRVAQVELKRAAERIFKNATLSKVLAE